jgi:hypothetical protein
MVPHGELQFCEVLTKSGIAEALVCAGADVNIDVFPKERPGYKLIHIAACSGVTEVHVSAAAAMPGDFGMCSLHPVAVMDYMQQQ